MAKRKVGRPKKSASASKTPRKPKNPTIFTAPNINDNVKDIVDINEAKKGLVYKCCICGESTEDIKGGMFPDSFSNLYVGWDFHLPVCKVCLDKLFDTYVQKFHYTEEEAARRICMTYDIYYCQGLVDIMKNGSKPNKRMSFYISKTSLSQYANKTYGNTLAEEKEKAEKEKASAIIPDDSEEKGVKESDYKFWGFGFEPEEIEFLNNKYAEWTLSHECSTHAQVTIFRQICMLELQILRNMKDGTSTAPLQKQLNDFMNSGNLQPKQNNDSTFVETNTFGTLIKKWENEKPISKPDPEWEDVDKIKHYISVWFLGHLCKMIGINNKFGQKWTKLYEDEVDRFTVSPPTYFDNEGEAPSFDDVFNK